MFEFEDGVADGGEGAHWLGFVEVAGEADFVADLDGVGLVPGVGGVREDFALQEGLNAAGLGQRDLLGVAQVRVGFVLDYGGGSVDRGFE